MYLLSAAKAVLVPRQARRTLRTGKIRRCFILLAVSGGNGY